MSDDRPKEIACKDLGHVAEHVVANPLGTGGVDFSIGHNHSRKRRHGETQQGREETDLQHYDDNGFVGGLGNIRLFKRAARIELHHTRRVGDRLDA